MQPNEYFKEPYRADLSAFCRDVAVPEHGPFGMLCGMEMGKLFEPSRLPSFVDAAGFLCTLYCLNLQHQGIYTYFPAAHAVWRQSVMPFVDARGCTAHHGGWLGTPDSIVRFARDPSYIPRARPIAMEDRVGGFVEYLFGEYLTELVNREELPPRLPSELLERLSRDPQCSELQRLMKHV